MCTEVAGPQTEQILFKQKRRSPTALRLGSQAQGSWQSERGTGQDLSSQ